MKKYHFLIFILLLVLHTSGCFHTSREAEASIPLNQFTIEIYDSIDLPGAREFVVKDYHAASQSFLALHDLSLIGFSSKKVNFQFKRFGRGPKEYFLYNRLCCYPLLINDTTIAINSLGYIKYFNIAGEHLFTFGRFDEFSPYIPRVLRGVEISEQDTNYIFYGKISAEGALQIRQAKTYMKGIASSKGWQVNSIKKKIDEFAPIQPENGSYNNPRYLIDNAIDYMPVYNHSNASLDIAFSDCFKLFRYSSDASGAYSVIDLKPDFAGEQSFIAIGENSKSSQEEMKRIGNTYYTYMNSVADTILLTYEAGVGLEKVEERFEQRAYNKEIQNDLWREKKSYVQYFIKDKKQCKDIPVPQGYSIKYMGDPHHLLLQKNTDQFIDDGRDVERVYFARVNEK